MKKSAKVPMARGGMKTMKPLMKGGSRTNMKKSKKKSAKKGKKRG